MIELFGKYLGTPLQGGVFITLLGILGLLARIYITGMPDRKRADNEGKKISADAEMQAKKIASDAEKQIRDEYSTQLKEFRMEVHGLRNELTVALLEQQKLEASRVRREGQISMLTFVLRLVMGELKRKDPNNPVLQQAEGLLGQIPVLDGPPLAKSDVLKAAENSVSAAVETAEQVRHNEEDHGGG